MKGFIRECLNLNQEDRMYAAQLLKHPWFDDQSLIPEVKDEEMKNAIINIKTFSKASKLQRTINSILIGLKLDKEDHERLKRIFKKLDTEDEGSIGPKEIAA